jgi:hypothetical protein
MINRLFDYWGKNYKINSIAKFSGELRAFLHWLKLQVILPSVEQILI